MSLPSTRPPSLVEQVAVQLAQLVRGKLLPSGAWLPTERQLSVELGVSRNVVREATKRLEIQGLVDIQHGVGTRAVDRLHRPLSESLSLLMPDKGDRLYALAEARISIEPDAAAFAARRATKDGIAGLRELHRQLEVAGDIVSAVEADCAFHREVARVAGNPIFGLVLDSLAELGRESRVRSMGRVGKEPAFEQHAVVLREIERGCAESAREAMRVHLLEAFEDLGFTDLKGRTGD